jgi:SAM-dependent methyltransferase
VTEPSGLLLGAKPQSYYEQGRPELVALLPARLGRVLDVGCGGGGVGRGIRGRVDFLAGIEVDAASAEHARADYDALIHVSVPNARHWSLVRDLVLRGTFGYGEWGHRDNTHLRWFTRRDLVVLLESTGWRVERTAHAPLSAPGRAAERLTRGLSAEFLVHQWSALGHTTASAAPVGEM